ncbi:HepT-like ribonuclease domain-containing protein [Fibrobacter sp.]
MLPEEKKDLFHLLGILESAGKISDYSKGLETADEFIKAQNQMVYNACLTLLTNICEELDKLSAETKSKLTKLDLRAIKGMRNRIVHDYQNLDSYIIFDAIQKDLPPLKETLYEVISAGLKNNIFDKEDFSISKDSEFYKDVDFSRIES